MLSIRIPVALCALALVADARPTLWVFSGVMFFDGGTLSGSLVFDPDAGTPCSLGGSPCGVYSNVNVTTTTGSVRNGATYHFVCGTDVPNCDGVSPDSTEVLLLTSNSANQNGLPGLNLLFTGVSTAFPPQGLTDAGGVVDISDSSPDVGAVFEAKCLGQTCFTGIGPGRFNTSGLVIGSPGAIPTLSDGCQLLLAIALLAAGMMRLRKTAPHRT